MAKVNPASVFQPPYATPSPTTVRLRRVLGMDWVLGWTLLLPVLIVLIGLMAFPFFTAISMSFQDRLLGGAGTWVGFANYAEILSNSGYAIQAAINTIVYTAFSVGIKFVIGMSMAAIVNHHIIWRDFWRGLLFLPWAVPAIVAAYTWKFIYDPDGFLNILLVDQLKLSSNFINFLGDPLYAMPALIAMNVWTGTPFYTMNFLAGMQSISEDQYEAAEIDGAGTWQRFLAITLPSLSGVILITTMLSAIWTSSNILQIYVLTMGGPQHLTATIPFYAYELAIQQKRIGAGAAVSMLMVPAYVVLVMFLSRKMLKQES